MTKHNYNNERHQVLEPVEIDLDNLGTSYAFSINPNDDHQYFKEIGSVRIKKATEHMKHFMRRFPNLKLDLYIDVSSLGRIHWHGFIRFKTVNCVRQFYEEIVYDLTTKNTLCMKHLVDFKDKDGDEGVYKNWLEYCQKVQKLWNVHLETDVVMKNKLPPNGTEVKYKDYFTTESRDSDN